jgi:hypothetical protein
MGGITQALQGLATLTGALESGDIEILELEMHKGANEAATQRGAHMTVQLPVGTAGTGKNGADEGTAVFDLEISPSEVEAVQSNASQQTTSEASSTDQSNPDEAPGESSDEFRQAPPDRAPEASDTQETPSDEQSPASKPSPDDESGDRIPCQHDECEGTFETTRGMKIHFTKTHLEGRAESEDGDDDRPAYADPAKLRRVYDRNDTFEEMTNALDVGVTPATVRRHMIKYGIYDPEPNQDTERSADTDTHASETVANGGEEHRPNPDVTAVEADAGGDEAHVHTSPDNGEFDSVETIRQWIAEREAAPGQLPSDDELPAGVTVADCIEGVVTSRTVHEVSNHLEVDREATLSALEKLGVLDLVQGRLDDAMSPEERERRVAERIEEMTAGQAQSYS